LQIKETGEIMMTRNVVMKYSYVLKHVYPLISMLAAEHYSHCNQVAYITEASSDQSKNNPISKFLRHTSVLKIMENLPQRNISGFHSSKI
jgi:hypothetical protein